VEPLPGAYARAIRDAAVVKQPYNQQNDLLLKESNVLGYVQVDQSVRVIGQGPAPAWDDWWYVRRDTDGIEGFAYGPWFMWHALKLTSVGDASLCENGIKKGGLDIQLQGGNGYYVFTWEDLKTPLFTSGQGSFEFDWKGNTISVREIESLAHYVLVWPWGAVSRNGKLVVGSGVGQPVEQETSTWLLAPDCGN